MPAKTGVPRLVFLLHHLCVYIQKYQPKWATSLSGPQNTAIAAVLTACNAVTALLLVPREEP
jgi:hypothetical protein